MLAPQEFCFLFRTTLDHRSKKRDFCGNELIGEATSLRESHFTVDQTPTHQKVDLSKSSKMLTPESKNRKYGFDNGFIRRF